MASYLQEVIALRSGRDLETLLRELYIEKRWTDREIAEHLGGFSKMGLSRQIVQQWRAGFGITRKSRKVAA